MHYSTSTLSKNIISRTLTWLSTLLLLPFLVDVVEAQNKDEVEAMYQKNNSLYIQTYDLIDQYPEISYRYVYNEEKELENVVISGVNKEEDRKQLETWLIKIKENNDILMNRIGPRGYYYVTEQEALPKNGVEDFLRAVQSRVTYPEKAQELALEGNIYVSFLVNSDGELSNVSTTTGENLDKDSYYVKQMMKEAKNAIKYVNESWKPATVNGVPVAQWNMLPVRFRLKEVTPFPYIPF